MSNAQDAKPGFHNFQINFNVIFATTTAEAMAQNLAAHLGNRLWKPGNALRCPADQSPMRVVRFKGSKWSAAYSIDRHTRKLSRLFSIRGMLEYTLGADWDYMHLGNSDTAGIAFLNEYQMGLGLRELVYCGDQNFNNLNPDSFPDSRFASLDEIEQRTAELGLIQSNFDGGARDAEGCIHLFENVEPLHEAVEEQFLLV